MKLKRLFQKRLIWRIAIYVGQSLDDIFNLERLSPVCLIGERGLRKTSAFQSVCADPFLYVHNKIIYIFYETKTDQGHGEISAAIISPVGDVTKIGVVLKEPFHLSYPQVFFDEDNIYMLPETAQSGQTRLYRAKNFPFEWELSSVVIDDVLLDPTLFLAGNGERILFGTTRENVLKICFLNSHITVQPESDQITDVDRSIARCGGPPILLNGRAYRVAQRNIHKYGEGVAFLEIKTIYPKYEEILDENKKIFQSSPWWASEGHHHISVVSCDGLYYIAVDGYTHDYYINTLTHIFIVAVQKIITFVERIWDRWHKHNL